MKGTGDPPRPERARRDAGVALVAVLWALLLLAMIAGSFSVSTRTQAHLARNTVDRAQAEALADAGLHRAILGVLTPVEDGGIAVDGTVYGWRFGGAEVRFAVEDEGGKVDLNAAPVELLAALLTAVGLEPATAAALADAIADYRDEDDDRLPRGAEAAEYRAAGRPYGPKNRPFEMVEELASVLGLPPELAAAMTPLVTIYTGAPEPVAALALEPVQQAMATMAGPSETPRRRSVAPRERSPAVAGRTVPPASDLIALTAERTPDRSDTNVYRIRSEARGAGGGRFVREAVIAVDPGGVAPFSVYAWRQGGPAAAAGQLP